MQEGTDRISGTDRKAAEERFWAALGSRHWGHVSIIYNCRRIRSVFFRIDLSFFNLSLNR